MGAAPCVASSQNAEESPSDACARPKSIPAISSLVLTNHSQPCCERWHQQLPVCLALAVRLYILGLGCQSTFEHIACQPGLVSYCPRLTIIRLHCQIQAIAMVTPSTASPEPAKNEAKNLKQKIDDTFDQALLHIDKWPNADLTVVTGYLMYYGTMVGPNVKTTNCRN